MRKQVILIALVSILLGLCMAAFRHIDQLNDGIEFKKIELKDNSAKLQILNSKYDELNKQINNQDADKEKLQQELDKLQKEREQLQRDLQAKLDKKKQDLASNAVNAATGTQKAYAAAPGSCSDYMIAAGVTDMATASHLISGESGCQAGRLNTSSYACGIAQSLPCTKLYPHATPAWINANKFQVNGKWFIPGDAVTEIKWMQNYVMGRYGSWAAAWAFWQRTDPRPYPGHWY